MREIVLFIIFQSLILPGYSSKDEERLVHDLFTGYNNLIRPVRNLSERTTVFFGMSMIQLINVNEKDQIMKSNVWLRMWWHDYQLHWDPADYGGIESIRVPSAKVWTPDIVLFNNADGNYEVSYKCNVVLYPQGWLLWIPPAIYKSSCTIDVEYFPFDQQQCEMRFGSWTFNGDQLTLDWYEGLQMVDLNDYLASGTWDIISVPGNITEYGDNPKRVEMVFHIVIRRKTLFYTINLLIPTVLISFLSVFVFYLPSDAGEKMTLCISILLALVVFLLLVSKILPPTSLVIPLIAKYLLFTFIMNIFTILVTVIIINWNYRTPRTHRMPKWVRIVFLKFLPKVLCMQRPKSEQKNDGKCNGLLPSATPRSFAVNAAELIELTDSHHPNCRRRRGQDHETFDDEDSPFHLSPDAHEAAENVQFIASHMMADDEYLSVREDWKYVALVIDRVQLIVFFGITAGGTIGLLINAPHIFEYVDQDAIINSLTGRT